MKLIDKLNAGKLDIVGDVHGELDALEALLDRLDYTTDGSHPDRRRLVFVGDLVDRGHDSPAVVETVMKLARAGHAQCVLGNHELNILRSDTKNENAWFFQPDLHTTAGVRPVLQARQTQFRDFFARLPIALERDDLRVVHASWNAAAIGKVREACAAATSTMEMYQHYQDKVAAQLATGQLKAMFDAEQARFGSRIAYGRKQPAEHWPNPRLLPGHAWHDEIEQMGNPISVLTSGEERRATEVYPAGGKFRFVDRVSWWDGYADEQAVVVGHYWRRYQPQKVAGYRESGWDLFAGIGPGQWLGERRKVFCIDFSVAGRASNRNNQRLTKECRLAALRWPEATLMFDDGEELPTDYRKSRT